MRSFGWIVCLTLCLWTTTGVFQPARAGWPSAEDVIKKVGPLTGLNGDQVEFAIFAMKEPSCAGTVAAYTAAQDYSLVAFIGALKATKLKSIPGMPSMSEAQCKKYNPVQQAYIFVDNMGNKLLGKGKADYLRNLLQEQIAEGKSSLDSEIESIPYLGPVLTNWDCECSAAFQTNLSSEKTIDKAVTGIISIGKSVKSGDIPGALETMITELGPKVACQLGAEWTGVGSIPVVSDIAAEACESVAGKAVGWVVSGASTTAQALGIIGGEHIPPDEYYKNMFTPEIAKDGYAELADILYGKCYTYFEASNMAASTAKKVCVGMRARYVEESLGKIQWTQFQAEREDYYNKNVKPLGVSGAQLTDADFSAVKNEISATCKSYFTQKYPKATAYAKTYGGEPIENICTSFVTYNKSSYHPWDIDKERSKAQLNLVNKIANKNSPFCKAGETRNTVVCTDQAVKTCFAELTDTCVKTKSSLGGMERPCCQLGSGTDSVFESNAKAAEEIAAKFKPYCKTEDTDPRRINCALKETYEGCLKVGGVWGKLPDCNNAEKYENGTAKQTCCTLDTSWVETVPGVKDVKAFLATTNIQYKESCATGGMQAGLKHDPRIANCKSGKPLEACQKKFPNACKKLPSQFVDGPCCDVSVFGVFEDDKADRAYSPHDRSKEELALTEKAIKESDGQCHYGKTESGEEDRFKVVCDTAWGGQVCRKILDRAALTACSKKMSENGWVTAPCCEAPRMGSLDVNARDLKPDTDEVIVPKDNKNLGNLDQLKNGSGDKNDRKTGGLGAQRKTSDTGRSLEKAGDSNLKARRTEAIKSGSDNAARDDQKRGLSSTRSSGLGRTPPATDKNSAETEDTPTPSLRSLGSRTMAAPESETETEPYKP